MNNPDQETSSNTAICIYCFEEKEKSAFTDEHVMPESFLRRPRADGWVLTEDVCGDCNQYFGENLDLILARDSLEGINRHRVGIRSSISYQKHKNLTFKIDQNWKGLNMKGVFVSLNQKENLVNLAPQVGFPPEGLDYPHTFFLYDDLEKIDFQDRKLGKKNLKIIAPDLDWMGKIIKKLSELGINDPVKSKEEIPNPEDNQLKIYLEGNIDRTIQRAITKIVFNYICKHYGKEILLKENFDLARRYIRYGEGALDIVPSREPILTEETENFRMFWQGYLISIECHNSEIIARIQFYNLYTYRIVLAKGIEIQRKGHAIIPGYDPQPLMTTKKLGLTYATFDHMGRLILRDI